MNQKSFLRYFERTFQLLSSLKLAVVVILALAAALAVGTVLESAYDTPTAQYWVYRALWFHALLVSLGVNIFAVALDRYPWKFRHIPFLLAHLGILTLLAGSWLTDRKGIDGSLRVTEGESASVVDIDAPFFIVMDETQVSSIPLPWIPPGVDFKPRRIKVPGIPFDLKIDQFISRADSIISFKKRETTKGDSNSSFPAIHLRIMGGPMAISQDFWLWTGTPGWQSVQMGPAKFALDSNPHTSAQINSQSAGQPLFVLTPEKDGSLSYLAKSSDGKEVRGRLLNQQIQGHVFKPGWKGDVQVKVEEWIPSAVSSVTYQPSRMQYGSGAPSSAIHVSAGEGQGEGVWLGLGDRGSLKLDGQLDGREIGIAYFPRRIVLPFSLRLDRFVVDHDPGTNTPAAYASHVTIEGAPVGEAESATPQTVISMNEPLELGGYTFYQASYEPGLPRPVTSILSVNRDPGRSLKYGGSLLIVLGSILLFAEKYRNKRKKVVSSYRDQEVAL